MILDLKRRSLFYYGLTFEDRLKMCEDHVLRGKSLSYISEENGNYDIANLKYLINLYKKFGSVLNSFLKIANVDIYVTGSNAKFLSSDVITEFRSRGDQVHVYPLS